MSKKLTTEDFILKARQVHGWRYDYSKVNYINANEKVCIICPKHGEFLQKATLHLAGKICPKCSIENVGRLKRENKSNIFIERAKSIHGDRFDYSMTKYVCSCEKVKIICRKHGAFEVLPHNHFNSKNGGCLLCSREKSDTEDFIRKARLIHGDKYDYSKSEYVKCDIPIKIICPQHGEFMQKPIKHLRGHGCLMCGGYKKYTQNDFINCAKEVHGEKYDYSKVNYINSYTKVCIICPEHGAFYQRPNGHLNGYGCPYCQHKGKKKMTTEEFISKSKDVWGNRFDYSVTKYLDSNKNVAIKDKVIGIFYQSPVSHLKGHEYRGLKYDMVNKEGFIKKAIEVHGNKYDYSKVEYVNSHTKVCIICPEHGEFWQVPSSHVYSKRCCPKCAHRSYKYTNEEFINIAKFVHNNKYDYSKVRYIKKTLKVDIICPIHGLFKQTPREHLSGCGCPKCSASHGELKIEEYLKNNGIEYKTQYTVKLERQMFARNNLKIDFYLPTYNTFIEFNGIQHYEFTQAFHKTEEDFNKQVERDKRLKQYCKENKIKLIVIKYNQIDKIEEILNKKLKIKNKWAKNTR